MRKKFFANQSVLFLLISSELVAFLWQRTKTVSLGDGIRMVSEDLGTECQVRLSGRFTIDSSPGLRALFFQRLESSSCQALTLDLSDVAYIDTSGLATLVETLKAAQIEGKSFRLKGLQERPRYLLEATRLLHLFNEVTAESPDLSHSLPERPQ